jgi:hypothetical protein
MEYTLFVGGLMLASGRLRATRPACDLLREL